MKRQRGMTMIEIALVLGVIFTLVALALTWYQSSRQKSLVGRYVDQYYGIVSIIGERYPRGNYTGITSAALTTDVSFPNQWRASVGGAILTPDGRTIVLSSTALTDRGQAANTAYQLQYPSVDSSVCIDFVIALATSAPQITVASTVVKSRTNNGGAIDRNTAITQCNSSSSGVTVEVISEG